MPRSDEVIAQAMLAVGVRGNVRTLTMRAYTADEEARILEGKP